MSSTPSTTYRIEFFSNPQPASSSYAQGQTFLGDATMTTDGNGNATFTATLSTTVPTSQTSFTATATVVTNSGTTYGDTSEFSTELLTPLIVPTVTTVTSSVNPSAFGQTVTFHGYGLRRLRPFDNGGSVQFAVDGTNYNRR